MAWIINTQTYTYAYGHAPRGTGAWAFQLGKNPEPFIVAYARTYGEALKVAKAEAKQRGTSRITVLP